MYKKKGQKHYIQQVENKMNVKCEVQPKSREKDHMDLEIKES